MRRWLVVRFLALVATACSVSGTRATDEAVPLTGRWGGDHIALTLTAAAGTLEYDCAHGGISEALRPDAAGRVEARGVHVREHGGPVREGERPDSVAARYVGRVQGDRLELSVFVGGDTLGPFELRRGAEARLFRCL